jgi:hypothetical protein
MDTTVGDTPTSWDEVDELIAELHSWGVRYLVGLEAPASARKYSLDQHSAMLLLQRLAQCDDYPRVRDAMISLLLLHPALAPAVESVLRENKQQIAERVAVLTLATIYLQQLWFVRLTIALGRQPAFPEQQFASLWESRSLPPPNCCSGLCGLLALQEAEQHRTHLPFTFLGDWQNQVDQLLLQEETGHHHSKAALSLLSTSLSQVEDNCGQESCMSMRNSVDKSAIEAFLQQLGRVFHKPARLYLVGGAALVHAGIRPGFTMDIDVQVSGANEGELIVAIQKLIERLRINIEFAAPGDFIPLPSHWQEHARFVGRYGSVDVFYFDFYSIALSKIERGNSRDIADVKLLVQEGIVTLTELDAAYQEVLAQLGKGRYPRVLPQRFAERYKAIRSLLVS